MERIEECTHEECEDGYCRKKVSCNQPSIQRQNTIPELQKLRMGLSKPAEFMHSEALRRSHSLRLSSSRTIELSHHSSVNSLDIDPDEHRYMISGAKNGRIIIHDLQTSCGKSPYVAKVIQKIDSILHWNLFSVYKCKISMLEESVFRLQKQEFRNL